MPSEPMTPIYVRSISTQVNPDVFGEEGPILEVTATRLLEDNHAGEVVGTAGGSVMFANPGTYLHAEDVVAVLDGYAGQLTEPARGHVEAVANFFRARTV